MFKLECSYDMKVEMMKTYDYIYEDGHCERCNI